MIQLIQILHALSEEKWVFACLIHTGIWLRAECLAVCSLFSSLLFLVVGVRNEGGEMAEFSVLLHGSLRVVIKVIRYHLIIKTSVSAWLKLSVID